MKTGTTKLLKFLRLKRRLQLPEWQVIGILETLWKVTESNTPNGAIGKLPNDGIAALMEYGGDPDSLIDSLVSECWIDLDPEFRLIVHDWSDHAPNHVKGNLKKYGREFADVIAKRRSQATVPRETPQGIVPPNQTITKPKPSPPPLPNLDPASAERQRQVAVVVTDVHSLGVAEAKAAVETAMGNGCDLDLIRAVANHYRREGGHKPTALYFRLLNLTPGQVIDDGWMPDWKPDQVATARRRRQATEAEQERKDQQASQAAAEEREQRYGPILDAMPDDEVAAMFNGQDFMRDRFRKDGRASPMIREWLISKLAGASQ